jgi:hypothetical protein
MVRARPNFPASLILLSLHSFQNWERVTIERYKCHKEYLYGFWQALKPHLKGLHTTYHRAEMAKIPTTIASALFIVVASAAQCRNLTIPISISAQNGIFKVPIPTNNDDTISFTLHASRQGHNYTAEVLTGYKTVAGDYSISATYCRPDNGSSEVVQVLTHGLGFDRRSVASSPPCRRS